MSDSFATPWRIACKPNVYGVSQARILEWVAISFSGGSSHPRDWTCSSFIGRQILCHWASREDFLKLFIIALCSFPVAYWTASGLAMGGGLIFWCHIFLPFHTVHGILKARILGWFTIPSPMDHILSELFTIIHPTWVALHSMAQFHWAM